MAFLPGAVQVIESQVLQAEYLAVGGAGRDGHVDIAVQGWDGYFRAQRGLGE